MYTLAHGFELFTLFCALLGAGLACFALWQNQMGQHIALIEKASLGITAGHVLSSLILFYAFITFDFKVDYVASYSDRTLPLFYRLTAFWAGQAGSLLFWALMVALCGAAFQFTKTYKAFSIETRTWYFIFYCTTMGFFSFLLTAWSDPFTTTTPAPFDGRGMNPLLQNPGMIIHPPLLFLGYGGFTIPSCLALAQALTRTKENEPSWIDNSRPFIMTAWIFLTAGIILGAWWAYMELGWGGYWAWDPVENASLLPWLIATAALHTIIIEQKRNKLQRVNIFLIALTTVSAFFATYLVRGNVVNSVHAFGDGGVSLPLLLFVLASTVAIVFISFTAPAKSTEALEGIETKEGFLVFTAWVLLAITVIVLCATIWPVISKLWSSQPIGLDAHFYNTVCLPLFTLLAIFLLVCPYLGWGGGLVEKMNLFFVLAVTLINFGASMFFGLADPLVMVASAAAIGVIASSIIQFTKKSTRSVKSLLSAHGVHLGLGLIVLGVAFSSGYKTERDFNLAVGQSAQIGEYTITLNQLYEGRASTFEFLEAELLVVKGVVVQGTVAPQKRIYNKFGSQSFSEVGTLPSLGNEIYATLFGLEGNNIAVLRVSINPLVNWIWIGSLLMCLFPFIALQSPKRKEAS